MPASTLPRNSLPPLGISLVAPTMPHSKLLASAGSLTSGGHSYYGTHNVLDTQSCFDSTFLYATPLLVSSATLGCTIVDYVVVATTINAFAGRCKFQLFVPIFRTGYVGTASRNNAPSLHATIQAIKNLPYPTLTPPPAIGSISTIYLLSTRPSLPFFPTTFKNVASTLPSHNYMMDYLPTCRT
jgi:hypothetical protein